MMSTYNLTMANPAMAGLPPPPGSATASLQFLQSVMTQRGAYIVAVNAAADLVSRSKRESVKALRQGRIRLKSLSCIAQSSTALCDRPHNRSSYA